MSVIEPPKPYYDWPILFLDTETTGLDPQEHEIWEVAAITPSGVEFHWQIKCDMKSADPVALEIGRYGERFEQHRAVPATQFVREFSMVVQKGTHFVGAIPSFDEERLRRLFRKYDTTPNWHYHLIDVEALAIGYLATHGEVCPPPWKSHALSDLMEIVVPKEGEHTALGDARWCKKIYERVMGLDGIG